MSIEAHLAQTEYKGWFNVGQLNNGKFPLVDFQKDNMLVSLKSVDTTGTGWMTRMRSHIDELDMSRNNGTSINGKSPTMMLDLRVQPGGAAAADPLVKYGVGKNVIVNIKEFK